MSHKKSRPKGGSKSGLSGGAARAKNVSTPADPGGAEADSPEPEDGEDASQSPGADVEVPAAAADSDDVDESNKDEDEDLHETGDESPPELIGEIPPPFGEEFAQVPGPANVGRNAVVALLGLAVLVAVMIANAGDDDASDGRPKAITTVKPAVTTTSIAPPTTVAHDYATILGFRGNYTGIWANEVTRQSGDIILAVGIDQTNAQVNLTIDLGGTVFGNLDPRIERFEAKFDNSDTAQFGAQSPGYGKVSGSITKNGVVDLTGEAPTSAVTKWHLFGTLGAQGGTLEFDVTSDGGEVQHGTFSITKSA